jgi:hypothetical protein
MKESNSLPLGDGEGGGVDVAGPTEVALLARAHRSVQTASAVSVAVSVARDVRSVGPEGGGEGVRQRGGESDTLVRLPNQSQCTLGLIQPITVHPRPYSTNHSAP